MKETLTIGKIIGVHGIAGELKVMPITNDPDRFYDLEEVSLIKNGQSQQYHVESVRLHKGQVLLALVEVPDRTAAEKLRNYFVEVDRAHAVDLEEDEYFITDLIGMTVYDTDHAELGKITDVLQTTGPVDTVEIQTPDKKIYVPARLEYFLQVNLRDGAVTADIPQEFFEL